MNVVKVFAVGATVTACVLLSGCAGVYKRIASKPCISGPLPVKTKIKSIRNPSPYPYEDNGEDKVGMVLTIDPESALAYFEYVERIEAVAEKAAGCVER